MATDYFDDASDSPQTMPPPRDAEPEEREETNQPTAVLPRSFFEAAGKEPEPGSLCTVRVVAAHEDSVEVEYESSGEEPEPELEEAPMPESGMADMMY